MRGTGKHMAPNKMQPMPSDNSSAHVYAQVLTYSRNGVPVHTESAREIAAWYQSPGYAGLPFAEFASSGWVSRNFRDAILGEIKTAPAEQQAELSALLAYVANRTIEGGVAACGCRDCFDNTMHNDIALPDLCHACDEAGCTPDDGACEREDSSDGEDSA